MIGDSRFQETLERLIFRKMRVFSRARSWDKTINDLVRKGVSIEADSFCVANAARLWSNVYNGAHNQATRNIDLFAYYIANNTTNDYVSRQYRTLNGVLRGLSDYGKDLDAPNTE